ncbi:hypothetical protein [Streptomyces sp. NPDC046197]|uniref:hypothetical protein n=1 Tax=Streptomyces sp. NPDC046197 TaxID=3154337 RepID=UPI0033FA6DF7
MLKSLSKLRAGTAAAAVLAAVAVAAPQAVAAEQSTSSASQQSGTAVRAEHGDAAAVGAATCGTGYHLVSSWALTKPDHTHVATLNGYENGDKGCAILANDQGSKQYMSLSLCKPDGTHCDTDSGMFSEYAGPMHVTGGTLCAPVIVKMGPSSSSLYLDFKNSLLFNCD